MISEEAPELSARILSNPDARQAYYDQRRANAAAREQEARETRVLSLLADIAQLEIERSTQQPMSSDEVEKLRARIKTAVSRM